MRHPDFLLALADDHGDVGALCHLGLGAGHLGDDPPLLHIVGGRLLPGHREALCRQLGRGLLIGIACHRGHLHPLGACAGGELDRASHLDLRAGLHVRADHLSHLHIIRFHIVHLGLYLQVLQFVPDLLHAAVFHLGHLHVLHRGGRAGALLLGGDDGTAGLFPVVVPVPKDLQGQDHHDHADDHARQQRQKGGHLLHPGIVVIVVLVLRLLLVLIDGLRLGPQAHGLLPLLILPVVIGSAALDLGPLPVRDRPGARLHVRVV